MTTITCDYIQKIYSNTTWRTVDTNTVSFDVNTIVIANHCILNSEHFTQNTPYRITYIKVFTRLDGYIGCIEHSVNGFIWRR